ncbi:hypothetical protein GCM10009754_80580 [Amycolatopsis minnesotensis]|uniref:Beta-N-acetylhexosaminidase n=1 Tax=Amycolatopsis minnesotensis TaxID=337894 RepID=A0ABP5E6M8_9PSEU
MAAVAVVAGAALAPPAQATPADVPPSVPAVRDWQPAAGAFELGAEPVIVAETAALRETADVFAADLRQVTGKPVGSRTGGPAGSGDILLSADEHDQGRAGYRLTVAPTTVVRGTADGVFLGTRTLVQWLRQRPRIPAGTATDWPDYPERGLLVDAGRRYFSLPWLRDRIRELSYLKMNYLHLHLSDVQGFRLDSATHPEIVADRHYTKAEIRELVAYAARYHVLVVPELDFPGHADAVLKAHPELALLNRDGTAEKGALDITKPEALALVRDLVTEFLPLFPGPYWHLGADEYIRNYDDYPRLAAYAKVHYGPNATGRDALYDFVNWADELVRGNGKTLRVANDELSRGGGATRVAPDVVVDHWSADGPLQAPWFGAAQSPRELIAAGHRVQNSSFTPTYYATGGAAALLNAPPIAMYKLWNPTVFVDGTRLDANENIRNLGAKLSVWCDDPTTMTEPEIADAVAPRLRVLAQLTWGSAAPPGYLSFLSRTRAVGTPPAG